MGEFSGMVREAMRAQGIDAASCDFRDTEIKGPHYKGDVRDIIGDGWHALVAHPSCRDLAVSGARWFDQKRADGSQQAALDFFIFLDTYTAIPFRAVENPVSVVATMHRPPDQYYHPWMHGHGETKKTGLWLTGFPPLVPSNIVDGRSDRIHKMGPGPLRERERSRTLPGVAAAMAAQWAPILKEHFQ
jgi:hypothetical protein